MDGGWIGKRFDWNALAVYSIIIALNCLCGCSKPLGLDRCLPLITTSEKKCPHLGSIYNQWRPATTFNNYFTGFRSQFLQHSYSSCIYSQSVQISRTPSLGMNKLIHRLYVILTRSHGDQLIDGCRNSSAYAHWLAGTVNRVCTVCVVCRLWGRAIIYKG